MSLVIVMRHCLLMKIILIVHLVPFDQPMLVLLKKILANVEVVDARLVKPLTAQKNISHEHHHH